MPNYTPKTNKRPAAQTTPEQEAEALESARILHWLFDEPPAAQDDRPAQDDRETGCNG